MQAYIATVKILVAAPSLGDACDVVSATLSDPTNTAFVDWSYLPTTNGNGVTYPEPTPDIDLDSYIEGSFLTDTPT